jgi:hypothetical protein
MSPTVKLFGRNKILLCSFGFLESKILGKPSTT